MDSVKVGIYAVEVVAGYKLVEFVPTNILLGQLNRPLAGAALFGVGVFVKSEDIMAVGAGATINGVLTLLGFA